MMVILSFLYHGRFCRSGRFFGFGDVKYNACCAATGSLSVHSILNKDRSRQACVLTTATIFSNILHVLCVLLAL